MTKCIIVGKGRLKTVSHALRCSHSDSTIYKKTGCKTLRFIQILFTIFYQTMRDGDTCALNESGGGNSNRYTKEFSSVEPQMNGEGEE